MTTAKYLSYVGGAAVAVGVGAALATASPGTAHADADTKSASVEKGPEKAAPEKQKPGAKLEKRLTKLADNVSAATKSAPKPKFDPADAVKNLQKQFDAKAPKVALKPIKPIADLAAKANEAADALVKLPTPKIEKVAAAGASDSPNPFRAADPAPSGSASLTAAAAEDDLFSNPFRADDPLPTDMPAAVLATEVRTIQFLEATPLAPLSPYYREGFEAAYRFSQMVPYVNAPIPLLAIVAALNNPDHSVPQTVINQLLLTTPPVSLLYYGYDEVADLLNVENQAYELKKQFYATVWDTLDPGARLHVLGEPGI
jgi:hypothetical protein